MQEAPTDREEKHTGRVRQRRSRLEANIQEEYL